MFEAKEARDRLLGQRRREFGQRSVGPMLAEAAQPGIEVEALVGLVRGSSLEQEGMKLLRLAISLPVPLNLVPILVRPQSFLYDADAGGGCKGRRTHRFVARLGRWCRLVRGSWPPDGARTSDPRKQR